MLCVDRPGGMNTTGFEGGPNDHKSRKGCKRIGDSVLKFGLVIGMIPDSSFVEGGVEGVEVAIGGSEKLELCLDSGFWLQTNKSIM